jgi:hypothetical protein
VQFELSYQLGPFAETRLPIGFRRESGEVVRSYTLRDLSAKDLRRIREPGFIRQHPFRWLGFAVGLCLDTLGGEPVSEEDRRFPAVEELAVRDVEYLIVAAHVHNYGPLATIRFVCPLCGSRERREYDLTRIQVTRAPDEFDPDEPVRVDLVHGVRRPLGKDPGLLYKQIALDIPRLKHVVAAEKTYRQRREFDLQLLRTLVRGVVGPGAEIEPLQPVEALGMLESLRAADWDAVARYQEQLPGIDRAVVIDCASCGAEVDQVVDPTVGLFLTGG